jgi:hypothetical protein
VPAPAAAPYTAPAYQAPAYSYSYPAYGAASPAPARTGRDPRVGDAHADRVVILPTAYTHPEGTLYMSSLEIIFLQIGYAVSDSTQITLTGVPPVGDGPDKVMLFDLSLKNAFVRDGPFRVAGIGSISGLFGLEEGNFVVGRAGAVAQVCFEASCESSATIGGSMLLAGPATFLLSGVGAVWRIADWAALLLEVDTLVPLGGEVGEFSGVAVMPGFRFPYRTWALDLGFARGLDTEEEPEPSVIPFVAFTYRFLP